MAAERRGTRPQRRRPTAKQDKENPLSVDVEEVSIEVEDLNDLEESINIQIFGPTGHGKTRLAAFAPNAYFVAIEAGVKTARRAGSPAKVLRALTWPRIVAATKWADEHLGPDDWVIIDSQNMAQMRYVRWLLEEIKKAQPTRDIDIPALQDHQKWQNAFKRWNDHLIYARYNTIFLCADMVREGAEGEDEVTPLILGGKHLEVMRHITSQMDMILYFAITEMSDPPVRRLLAQPVVSSKGALIMAKDRYHVLGQYLDVQEDDDTVMEDIISLIRK